MAFPQLDGVREGALSRLVLAVPAALLFLGLGYLVGSHADYALAGAALIVLVGLVAVDLTYLPVLAFPSMLLLSRVGGGNGLSLSDLMLFLATICALPQLRTRESPELRGLLWVVVAYQACLIPALVYNPYQANYIEWVHEALLVGGSMIVGWVVGRSGRARWAFSAYVLACVVIAIWACIQAPADHFKPVYLPTFQKNALGDLLAFAAIVAYARPQWIGWTARWANLAVFICLLGMLASQSKQAMVSVAAGILLIVLRGASLGRRSRFILVSLIPLLVIAYVVTTNQLASENKFNAAHQRLTWYTDSITIWHVSEWFGVGLRWWYTPRFPVSFQPPNAEFEMLTSGGIIGLAGFLVTSAVALWLLWHMDARYGVLGLAIVSARLVQGQLDLFWVASQSSVPWLIVGTALGVQSLHRFSDRDPPAEQQVALSSPRVR